MTGAYDIVGWVGAVLLLAAYGLVSLRGGGTLPLGVNPMLFHALNLVGAGCLVANALEHGALPIAALNGIWMILAVVGLTGSR